MSNIDEQIAYLDYSTASQLYSLGQILPSTLQNSLYSYEAAVANNLISELLFEESSLNLNTTLSITSFSTIVDISYNQFILEDKREEEEYIQAALINRNEIVDLEHTLDELKLMKTIYESNSAYQWDQATVYAYQQLVIDMTEVELELKNMKEHIESEINILYALSLLTVEKIQPISQSYEYSKTQYEVMQQKFQLGMVSERELLASQANMLLNQSKYNQIFATYAIDLLKLEMSAGVGYELP